MSEYDDQQQLTDDEKIRIVGNFINQAPPGEFKNVLDDVRLLNNDTLLKEQTAGVFLQYSKDQLTPVHITIDGTEHPVLVTKYNDLGSGRFYDPRTRHSFKFNVLSEEASQAQEQSVNIEFESWRSTLDEAWNAYCKDHYRHGISAVFVNTEEVGITLTACIEDHQFQPKNFWNGRWRSIWSITFDPNATGEQVKLEGIIKVQVHYYEDGNVQLVSTKEISKSIAVNNEQQLAQEFVKLVEAAENEYQNAISENYQTMSDVTFKALRRPLPLTRSKVDWANIKNYRIGTELKQN